MVYIIASIQIVINIFQFLLFWKLLLSGVLVKRTCFQLFFLITNYIYFINYIDPIFSKSTIISSSITFIVVF